MKPPRRLFPTIIAFACEHSAYKAACEAVSLGGTYHPGVHLLPVPCSGRVDLLHILKAFEDGADGVVVMGCFKDSCNYVMGNVTAERRIDAARKMLADLGVEPERLRMCFTSPASPARLMREIQKAVSEIAGLGPLNPPEADRKEAEASD